MVYKLYKYIFFNNMNVQSVYSYKDLLKILLYFYILHRYSISIEYMFKLQNNAIV